MQELINNPLVIDLIAAVIFAAAACAGLVRGFYKKIMPFAVVVLAGLGAIALSATLTAPWRKKSIPSLWSCTSRIPARAD